MEVVTVHPEEALAVHKVDTLTGAARSLVCSRDALEVAKLRGRRLGRFIVLNVYCQTFF